MDTSLNLFVIGILLAFILIGIRIWRHFTDKASILDKARHKGWKDVRVRWAPFAPGFFFEHGERNYEVSYTDQDGYRIKKYCKTSLFTGVYFRE
jgi:hypothetical protein